ncbi:hypothetical protein CDEST_10485 [Colletotrichum destructivum]|uniref:Uncharacterized protein n=1 Tax=Colletotrichum destructivum TaxID=34406 RepID=A0AAX4IQE8_9PEZI|nr:hypothetical protein CDEST_10485 [Colletotrichum destructivum]
MELSSAEIVSLFWGRQPDFHRLINGDFANKDTINYRSYFDYFQIELRYANLDFNDFQVIKNIVSQIKADESRNDILEKLQDSDLLSKEVLDISSPSLDTSINLAAQLLVMCNFGPILNAANSRRYLEWSQDSSLRNSLASYFDVQPNLNDIARLPKVFHAWTIANIGGIRIQFTDNLMDHLLLIHDDATLVDDVYSSLLPRHLIEETLQTLSLLFPQAAFASTRRNRRSERKWFKKLCQQHILRSGCQVDQRVVRCGTLQAEGRQIENFTVWRDRLIVLKQAYDETTPSTLSQWWYDRRNGPQWFTFWGDHMGIRSGDVFWDWFNVSRELYKCIRHTTRRTKNFRQLRLLILFVHVSEPVHLHHWNQEGQCYVELVKLS